MPYDMKLNVLYVDDEPINLKIFAMLFKQQFQTIVASSGYEAMEVLEAHPEIEVVVSDYRMPEMDGLTFIQKAKQIYANKTFYMLSGYEILPEIQEALDSGLIEEYFVKPVDKAKILEAIMPKTSCENEEPLAQPTPAKKP